MVGIISLTYIIIKALKYNDSTFLFIQSFNINFLNFTLQLHFVEFLASVSYSNLPGINVMRSKTNTHFYLYVNSNSYFLTLQIKA